MYRYEITNNFEIIQLCLSLFDKNKTTCSSVNYALYKTVYVPKIHAK